MPAWEAPLPFTIRLCRLFPAWRRTIEQFDILQADLLSHRRILIFFLAAICLSFSTFQAKTLGAETITTNCDTFTEGQWTWVDNSGQHKTDAELRSILKQHQTWLDSAKTEGKQADLSGAKLKKADLRQVNLVEANLANSDLSYADLTRAVLNKTVLREANLECARLDETQLQGADLTKADLSRTIISNAQFDAAILVGAPLKGRALRGLHFNSANLNAADLSGADLTNAEFTAADLRNAHLRDALLVDVQLKAAQLEEADLFGATYEARNDPKPRSIALAKNIEYMTHGGDSESLARLRREFKEAGFRDQERKITFALKSRQGERLWAACDNGRGNCFEYLVNRYLFDVTSQYGMNPGRVLIIILGIFCVSIILYWCLIHYSKDSGLSLIIPADRNNQPLWLLENLSKEAEEIREGGFTTKRGFKIQPRELHRWKGLGYSGVFLRRELALLWVSFVFSLMSTFNIKFRDVDFGRWLRQLTTKEYDIKATGWARTVAGLQALLSVYLVALLLVTYFGRPFE